MFVRLFFVRPDQVRKLVGVEKALLPKNLLKSEKTKQKQKTETQGKKKRKVV